MEFNKVKISGIELGKHLNEQLKMKSGVQDLHFFFMHLGQNLIGMCA